MTDNNNWLIAEDWLLSGVLVDKQIRLVITNLNTNIQVYDEPISQAVMDILSGKILRHNTQGKVLATQKLRECRR